MLLTTVAVLLGGAVPSSAATTEDPAEAGAGWIASKLVDGNHLEVTFDGSSFPDYGLTADAVFAFDAAGVAQDAASRATDYLEDNVGSYVGDGEGESYAGALAKLVNLAAAQGVDPTAFGGRDLVTELSALECGSPSRSDCPAGDTGRFSDKSAFGNFSNGIGQSLALIGLERTTSTGPSAASVTFLIGQQCDDGGFPENFNTATCTSSIDTTGFATQALLLGGPAAAPAAQDAIAFLKSVQNSDGSFTGNDSDNTNTTALAAQALTAAGESAAAASARQFIASLQSGCSASPADRGKIAYDAAGGGDDLRASTQAVPALAGVPLGQITSDGAEAEAPTLACAAVPTTTPGATTTTTPGTGTGTGSGGTGSAPGGGVLANTGGAPRPAVAGGALLMIGAGLVLLARRRALPS
jgi:hypothetical protein